MLDDNLVNCPKDLAAALLQLDQLGDALESRLVIGQALGILMERLDLDASSAFRFLVRVSSTSNRKLRDLAEELVETRVLPGVPDLSNV